MIDSYELPASWEDDPDTSASQRKAHGRREIILIRRSPSPDSSWRSRKSTSKNRKQDSETTTKNHRESSTHHKQSRSPRNRRSPPRHVRSALSPSPPYGTFPGHCEPVTTYSNMASEHTASRSSRRRRAGKVASSPLVASSSKVSSNRAHAQFDITPSSDPGRCKSYSERAFPSQSKDNLDQDNQW